MHRFIIISVSILSAFGCAMPSAEGPSLPGSTPPVSIAQPSEDEIRALDFLNDPATDLRTLDHEVGVNRRGARNLIAHRNGPDGIYPSYDDDPFQTLEEIERVRYVGPVSVQMILDFARDRMVDPGVMVEGILFSSEDEAAVLWGLARVTVDQLTYELGIATHAAEGIVGSGPYESIVDVAAIEYVGQATLLSLLHHAPVWAEEMLAVELP